MKTQSIEKKPAVTHTSVAAERFRNQRTSWDSFLRLWERANLIRSFLWNQEITDATVLLTQFLTRLRRFFRVDFCFAAVLFEGAQVLEVGLPESKRERLPVNFARHCLDLIANSRVPIVWKQPRKPFEFCSTVVSPLSPSFGRPLGFVMMGHCLPKNFASSELFLLQSLSSELSWAIRELRSKINQKKLLATVSQELKNPLQLIVGHSALLRDDLAQACSPQQLDQFQKIEMSTRQLVDLLNGMVNLTVVDAGNSAVLEEPIDLIMITTLQEMFAYYRTAAEERGLEFESKLAADLPATIVTDPVKFRQIVHNLIGSAIISTAKAGVQVEVKRGKGLLEIIAKERGARVAVKSDRNLYRFSSPGENYPAPEVRGEMGLRLVKEFSGLLKGHVHVQSRPGEGSEFTVCLPCE